MSVKPGYFHYDLTVDEEHNFFVTADTTGEPVLLHNQTQGFFCGVPVDADLADNLLDLNRRLDASRDAGQVGTALTRLGDDLGDDLAEQGVDRILNVILDVERRGDTDLAELMARNLAGDRRATEGIVRRELDFAQSGSANAGLYSQKVLGDDVYAEIWGSNARFRRVQDVVHQRIEAPADFSSAAEDEVAQRLRLDGRDTVNHPLEVLPDAVLRGDSFTDGVETDFKTLTGISANTLRTRISESFANPQGGAVAIDTRRSDGVFDRNIAEELVLTGVAGRTSQVRVDVILSDETILTWRLGVGFAQ